MRNILILLGVTTILTMVNAQVDNLFWLAPPPSNFYDIGDEDEIELVITAMHTATVTIEKPATGFVYQTIVSTATSTNITLAELGLTLADIETPPQGYLLPADTRYKNGIKITSDPGSVTVSYKLTANQNQDQISLKGQNALGTDFYVSTQNQWPNVDNNYYSGFTLVATEDNTTIEIERNAAWFGFGALPGGVPETVTIELNMGETYTVQSIDNQVVNHINGVKVHSDKNIAITYWDDQVSKRLSPGTTKDDFAGDQLIPESLIGYDYIVMKGGLASYPGDGGESIFITGTVDGTIVEARKFDGTLLSTFTVDAGDVQMFAIDNMHTYIHSDQPIYINHYSSIVDGSGGKALAAAVLPQVGPCTGSHEVIITRSDDNSDKLLLNIVAVNDTNPTSDYYNQAINNFYIETSRGVTQIPPEYFVYSYDSAYVALDNIKFQTNMLSAKNPVIEVGETALITNYAAKFHLGVIEGFKNAGAKYGYFSDYGGGAANAGIGGALATKKLRFCSLDPITLVASGGTTYSWIIDGLDASESLEYLSDLTISDPVYYPDEYTTRIFYVTINTLCGGVQTIPMQVTNSPQTKAYFDVETDAVCSPDSMLIMPGVLGTGVNMKWYFNTTKIGRFEVSDTATDFYHDLSENTTDTIIPYKITLITGYSGACSDEFFRTINVKPAIYSNFEFNSDSIGCHPLGVELKNNSTGDIDSNNFLWSFGDYTISYEVDSVNHTYNNYTAQPDTFLLELISRSNFDCLDTMQKEVVVFPRVKALFSTTPNQACSPLIFDVNPVNTVGADSLFWNFDLKYDSSSFVKTDKASMTYTHVDTTVAEGPDTLYVRMHAKNIYGCYDTALTHRLIAFPAAISDFDVSDTSICDADTIFFKNKSDGYNLDFYWDLGDGTAPNDSTPLPKQYFNASNADDYFLVSLEVISSNGCVDYKDTLITVHPYIDANFGINFVKNCSPLKVNITDNTYRVHNFTWDLGDGVVLHTSGDFTHTYLNPLISKDTTYIVKLIVSNNEGCSDSISRSLTVKPQVVADMNLVNYVGCSPLNTSFENLSQGGSYYIWSLGGNNQRTDTSVVNFNQIFSNSTAVDNIYPISLKAINDAGCDSTVYDTVEVFADISAAFTFEKDSACSPFTPVVTNNSALSANVFRWYKDGVLFSSDKAPIIPEYITAGDTPESYLYTLVAMGQNDVDHELCADTHSIRIKVFPALATTFTLDDLAACQPLNTLITNTSNLIDSTQFTWYLDNYIYSTSTNPGNLFVNNYTNSDVTHNFKVQGVTNHGCRDTFDIDVVAYAYIDANFTINKPAICSGDTFTINRYNTRGAIDNYSWDLSGTASTISSEEFNYSFDNLGSSVDNRIITLTVSNVHCDSTWIDSINVYPKVISEFAANDSAGCHPFTTGFSNTSRNADYYYWNFGDGVSSTTPSPSHTFNNYNTEDDRQFPIRLIAESQYRCRDTSEAFVISYAQPKANFFMPLTVSCQPFNWSVFNSTEGPVDTKYFWDLGITTSTEYEPTAVYDNNETSSVLYQDIFMRATTGNGCKDSLTQQISIYPRIDVDFTTEPEAGCSPLSVTFIGDTVNVQQMVWYVDDKLYSSRISPTGQFLNDGNSNLTHNVKFVAFSRYNCVDSSESIITVYPSPAAEFAADPIPALYDTTSDATLVNFDNQTQYLSSWNYNWAFGDGNEGTQPESSFDYEYGAFFWGPKSENFSFNVQLVASNQDNPECRDTIEREIMILPPIPQVEIGEEISGCIPLTVDFSAYTKYAYDDNYEWNFGDGSDVNNSANPTHVFNRSGTYTVKLSVEGDGGPAADYKLITVYPQPIADFSFNDTVVYVASQTKEDDRVNFYNQTKYGTNYEWYFDAEDFYSGASPQSEAKDPIWAYNEVGVYYPVLVAYSNEGCSDTLKSLIAIKVLGEGVLEFPTAFFVDPNTAPADEYNTSQITPNMYVFYPRNSGVAKYRLEIYNRWGTLMFETTDVNQGWNGYFDGDLAKQDVYIYRARGNFTNGQPFDLSGDVTLFHSAVNINP